MRSHSSKPGPRAGIFKLYAASGVALTILFYTTFALGMGVVKRSYWQWRELAIAAGEESGFGRYIGDCLTFRVDRHERAAALVEQSLPVEAASQEPAPTLTTPSVTPTPPAVPASASRRRTELGDVGVSEQPAGTVLVGSATQPSATPSDDEGPAPTEAAAESEPEPQETTAASTTVIESPTIESAPAPQEEKKRKFWQKVGGIFKGKKKPAGEPAR